MSPRGTPRPTRREALALLGGGMAWALAGCGSEPRPGSTLMRSLVDPDGDALLASGPGVPLMDRRDLGGGGRPQRVLARMAQLADPHVRDAQSPARVPFLDRLGPRLGSAFRPHELLTAQLLAATVASVNEWGEADAVLVSGDLIDSASATSWTGPWLCSAEGRPRRTREPRATREFRPPRIPTPSTTAPMWTPLATPACSSERCARSAPRG